MFGQEIYSNRWCSIFRSNSINNHLMLALIWRESTCQIKYIEFQSSLHLYSIYCMKHKPHIAVIDSSCFNGYKIIQDEDGDMSRIFLWKSGYISPNLNVAGIKQLIYIGGEEGKFFGYDEFKKTFENFTTRVFRSKEEYVNFLHTDQTLT